MLDFDELLLHVARLDRRHRAAHGVDARQFFLGLGLERLHLALDLGRAVEDVAVVEQVGLVGQDLLHAQRPLLVPRPRQAERLVPGRQLHGAGARVLRQRHHQHLEENSRNVVFGLLLGQSERIHLHAVAEQPLFGVFDVVALFGDLVPQFHKGTHFAHFGDEREAGVDEERDAPDHLAEFLLTDLAESFTVSSTATAVASAKASSCTGVARLLQMVRADVHRIPLRQFVVVKIATSLISRIDGAGGNT